MTKRTVTSWALVGLFFAGSMLGCGSDEATTDGNVCVPTAEICDGKDNNCNGQIDENLTQECTEGGAQGRADVYERSMGTVRDATARVRTLTGSV